MPTEKLTDPNDRGAPLPAREPAAPDPGPKPPRTSRAYWPRRTRVGLWLAALVPIGILLSAWMLAIMGAAASGATSLYWMTPYHCAIPVVAAIGLAFVLGWPEWW